MGEWRVRRLLWRLGIEVAHDRLLRRRTGGPTDSISLARLPDRHSGAGGQVTVRAPGRAGGRANWTQRIGPAGTATVNALWQNALHVRRCAPWPGRPCGSRAW